MSFISSRSCPTCDPDLYWPYTPAYIKCPMCERPTIMKTVDRDKVLTKEEAKVHLAYVKFEKWSEDETEAAKRIRQSRARDAELRAQWEREEAAKFLQDRFVAVISAGGFTQDEQETYTAIERNLPVRNNPRYADPLAD